MSTVFYKCSVLPTAAFGPMYQRLLFVHPWNQVSCFRICLYWGLGCNGIEKAFHSADYHSGIMYNAPVRLRGDTIWPVGLKFLCRASQTSTWGVHRKAQRFPNLQISYLGLTKLCALMDYQNPRRKTALFYMTAFFWKLVQSAMHEFFREI
jgi:hypothetical protein